MRWMARISLGVAVLSSVATSRDPGPEEVPPPPASVPTLAVANAAERSVDVEVRLAEEVDCERLAVAPWLAPALEFSTLQASVTLAPDQQSELVDVGTLEGRSCYAAELRTPGHTQVAVVFAQPPRADGRTLAPQLVMVDPEHASGFFEVAGVLHDPADLEVCDALPTPSWHGEVPGPKNLLMELTELEDDCWALSFEPGKLELCGVDVPFASGEEVWISATPESLSIDNERAFLHLGTDLESFDLKVETAPRAESCVTYSRCGAAVPGDLWLDELALVPGEPVDLEDGVLLVDRVWLPLQGGCPAEIGYQWVGASH